jgi:hypothetical protein
MLDKRGSFQERLGKLGLASQREEEIVRELGEHLEDHAAALEGRGMTRDQAAQQVLDAVSDWTELVNEIVLAEREEMIMEMNYRTKVLWLPALCALFLSNVLLAIIGILGYPPYFYWLSPNMSTRPYFVFVVPWLLTQPVVGAVAAYWSRRAGGAVTHQVLAALAPAIAMMGVFVLILPFAIMLDEGVAHHIQLTAFLVLTATWVLLPSIPLFLGAAPFLKEAQPRA